MMNKENFTPILKVELVKRINLDKLGIKKGGKKGVY